MKVALIGYGKMGKAIDSVIHERHGTIVSRIHLDAEDPQYRTVNETSIGDADVCIDFSHPDSIINTIQTVASLRKPLVVGTSGWYDKLNDVQKIVQESGIGFIYAQNFSIGISLFLKIVSHAAQLIDPFDEYDVAVEEIHHREKADSPSGTAQTLAKVLIDNITRKKEPLYGHCDKRIAPDQLHVTSLRCGHVPGTHTVTMDSPDDTITLSLRARSRNAWARGALLAAEWILGKEGFYHFDEVI